MTDGTPRVIFALEGTRGFGEGVAACIGTRLAEHEERTFEDGEHKIRPLVDVHTHEAFVIHSLHGDEHQTVNDKLCRLLFFIAALKDAGAPRVTALVPYLAYARKDRRTQPRDPVTLRYVAQLFEASGVDRMIALEPHNDAAFDNALRCASVRLNADTVMADAMMRHSGDTPLAVVSPDSGGSKRADRLRLELVRRTGREVTAGFVHKHRSEGRVRFTSLSGDVSGRTAVIVDDLIVSGATLLHAVEACRQAGAVLVIAAATHGLFSAQAERLLGADGPDRVLITNTIRQFPPFACSDRVEQLSVEPLFAAAIADLTA